MENVRIVTNDNRQGIVKNEAIFEKVHLVLIQADETIVL